MSPDLKLHPVGSFLAPLFRVRRKEDWQAFCYSDVLRPDRVTEWFQSRCDQWRHIAGLGNDEVAQLIQQDRIDILFDLAGHTGNNRLRLFAGKPAPVQVSWMGYLDTTGLPTIDYLLADHTVIQEDEERLYSEKVFYLPGHHLCYDPPGFAPPVNALPTIKRGYITFGSFNQLVKAQPPVIELWSRILTRSANGTNRFSG